jgi:proprotein convertase subtilisin/kexin type 5
LTCVNTNEYCLTCVSNTFRTFSNNVCPCNDGYFENGVSVCAICSTICKTCVTTDGNCLSCYSA